MNIKTFASRIGVSTATVSRAFSDKGRISPATRSRVREQANVFGYSPNRQARSMVRGTTDALAIFYDAPQGTDSDFYLAELTYGMASAAAEAGMLLQMHAISAETARDPERIAALARTGTFDGFILYLTTEWSEPLLHTARERDIPFVILDNTRRWDEGVLSVGGDIKTACIEAGRHLRRAGRRQPGFIHGLHDADKLAGFRVGLGELAETLICDPGGVSFEDACRAFERLHRRCPSLDALLCGNDVLAMGAIRAALKRGVRVPEDLAVIGCDDVAMARFTNPSLTTIRLPKEALGRQAVATLMASIQGNAPVPGELPPCELILRESG